MEDRFYNLNKKAFLNYLMIAEPPHMWNWHVDAYFEKNQIKEWNEAYHLIVSVVDDPSAIAKHFYLRDRVSLKLAKETIENDTTGDPSVACFDILVGTHYWDRANTKPRHIEWAKRVVENDPVGQRSLTVYLMLLRKCVSPKWALNVIENSDEIVIVRRAYVDLMARNNLISKKQRAKIIEVLNSTNERTPDNNKEHTMNGEKP